MKSVIFFQHMGYTLNFILEFFFQENNFMVLQFFFQNISEQYTGYWIVRNQRLCAFPVLKSKGQKVPPARLALPTMRQAPLVYKLGHWVPEKVQGSARRTVAHTFHPGMNWSWGSERDPTSFWLRASVFQTSVGFFSLKFPSMVYSTGDQDHQQCTPNPSTDSLLGRKRRWELTCVVILEF